MFHPHYDQAVRETFGNSAYVTDCRIIADGYRNFTAGIICNAHPAPLFYKEEKPFLYPRMQKFQISREKAALSLCTEEKIPVPKILAAKTESEFPWILEEFIPGAPISSFSFNEEEKQRLSEEFYPVFQRLCQIRADHYGDTFDGGYLGKHQTWNQTLREMTRLTFEDCCQLDLFAGNERLVKNTLDKAFLSVSDNSPPTFFHSDLFSANVMGIKDKHGQIRLSALIDFGMSLYAPLNYVRLISQQYCDLLPPAHLESFPEDSAARKIYDLLRIEPLLLMKIFHYPDTDAAIFQYIEKCKAFKE